jgi:hypothetical protein
MELDIRAATTLPLASFARRTSARAAAALSIPAVTERPGRSDNSQGGSMLAGSSAFSGFSVDDIGKAKEFYGPTIAWFRDPAGNSLSILDEGP